MAINKLDQIINEQMLRANMAVKTLHAMGLSVTNISIGESCHPMIQITPGIACSTLPNAYSKRMTRSGRRIIERVAFVADCEIKWEEFS
ncbi:hypothetical protein [Nitrincola iocasae]|uniref:Uncharacterized protein n=1 Tax=Nitrincola iocasae TaxID=2614693 RepID=A0A5J6LAT7_9GAMM|nr:hypothetical protein [Nitrincola iocasae]QEW05625.1 hypothetical protein F5I99_03485 [Nitrincola iocasae]